MDEEQDKSIEKKSKQERGGKRNYPLINLDDSLKIAEVVKEMKGNATIDDISKGTGNKGGGLLKKIASARRWGLIDGQGNMTITPLAMDILHPEKDEDVLQAKLKAYFNVPIFKTIYETYGWSLPRKELLTNVLIRQGVPEKDATTLTNLIYLYKTLFDEQVLEIEVEPEDKNIFHPSNGPKVIHGVEEFKKLTRGGERLTENRFNLILCLGSLRESIKNFDKDNVENLLGTLEELISESPIIKGQVEILKSDISILDEESIKKVMPQRINTLIQAVMHILGVNL